MENLLLNLRNQPFLRGMPESKTGTVTVAFLPFLLQDIPEF
jgi:hypothetical protein